MGTIWSGSVDRTEGEIDSLTDDLARITYEVDRLREVVRDLRYTQIRQEDEVTRAAHLNSTVSSGVAEVKRLGVDLTSSIHALRGALAFHTNY